MTSLCSMLLDLQMYSIKCQNVEMENVFDTRMIFHSELYFVVISTLRLQVLLLYIYVSIMLLASSRYSEGPAIGHLDTGFSWFPCVYKWMLRWFPRLQVATTCFSCSPPDLNLLVTNFIFCIHVKLTLPPGNNPIAVNKYYHVQRFFFSYPIDWYQAYDYAQWIRKVWCGNIHTNLKVQSLE